jgi:hypothetical protein
MKSLIYKILIFCIPLVGFIFFTEICVRNFPSVYKAKKEQLVACADSVELLILGASSAMDGIDPAYFSVYAYNLAFAAQPIYFDAKLTEKYLPVLPKLKYVVITVGYVSLYMESPDRAFFYKYYYDIDYKGHTFWKEKFLQSFFAYNSTHVRYMLSHSFINRPEINLKKGWSGFNVSDSKDIISDARAQARADTYERTVRDYKESDTIFREMEAFIEFLQSRNITPVLVSCPNYETLRKHLDKYYLEKNKHTYESLSEKYNIIFMDLMADEDFTAEDFYNPDHLNKKGAAKLARKINAEIIKSEKK